MYLLGSEGTIESGIYQKALETFGIVCRYPAKEEYVMLRDCIEAVKQNKYTDKTEETFLKLMEKQEMAYILGCTELPILYQKYIKSNRKIYDPLKIAMKKLKEEYENE